MGGGAMPEPGVTRTCLNSSRVNTRRDRGSGNASTAAELVTETTGAAVVVIMGASASGSVMFVSWEVLRIAELSNNELASGEIDRRIVVVGCDAGGESWTRGLGSVTRPNGVRTMEEHVCNYELRAGHLHTSASSPSTRDLAPSTTGTPPGTLWLSEHNFLTAGCSSPLSTTSRGRFLGEPFCEDGGEGVA